MPPKVTLSVDVLDALAKRKLTDLGIQADKLNTKKIVIKSDLQGNAEQRVIQLKGAEGQLVTMNERWLKSGKQVTTVTQQVSAATDNAGKSAATTTVKFSTLNYVMHRLAYATLSAVIRSFREAITEMKNVDTQLTVISRVTQTNIADLENLKNKAYEVGSAYGVMASDYLSAAAAFSRAGYREQAEELAELSSKLQIAGGVSADVANQFLIATDKAYQLNGSVTELSAVMDKLTVIDHNYATSVEKIADGMGIVAPVAAQAHMSTDELIASLGTITAVTQRSGTEAARALRALILSIIKDTTTEIDEGVSWTIEEINSLQDALKLYAPEVVKAAEATGQLIDPMEAIAALAKSYEDGLLTEAKLAQLTSSLGGKLRASQLLSLIQNYSGMYTDMLNQMQSATGAVDKDIEMSLESWEVKIKQLKNTFTEFVQKSLSSNFFKGMIDAIKWLIDGFGSLGNVLLIVGSAFAAMKIPNVITSIKALTAAVNASKLMMSAYQAAIMLVAAAFSAIVIAGNKAKQAEEEATAEAEKLRNKNIEEAKSAITSAKKIDELYKNYKKLQSAFEDGTSTRAEYAEAQKAIISYLQDEGLWTEDATSGYNTLTAAIDANTEAALRNMQIRAYSGYNDAYEEFKSHVPAVSISGGATSDLYYSLLTAAEKYVVENEVPEWLLKLSPRLYGAKNNVEVFDEYGDWSDAIVALLNEGYFENGGNDDIIAIIDFLSDIRDKYAFDESKSREFNELNSLLEQVSPYLEAYREYVDTMFSFLGDKEIEYVLSQHPELKREYDRYKKDVDNATSAIDEQAASVKSLSQELEGATKALKKYNTALKESGEKGDALKSYSEAYKKAVEMYEKGLTGSNQYMSAVDLLFGEVDDYEEAGKLLGNAFVKAMFEGGGEDYGANAANYIRKHLDEFEGVAITEGEDGTFGLDVTNMDKFAESTGLTVDALWTLIDALDIFHSKTTYTRDQLFNFMGLEDNGVGGIVNLTEKINDLAGQGKSAREIKGIVDAIKELAETDGNITISEPEDLDQTIKDIVELNEQAKKDKDVEVSFDSNIDEFVEDCWKKIDQLNGTTIYIGLKTVGGSTSGTSISRKDAFKFWQTESRASGTTSARGGLSLVNEEGAELIYANGKAWIAGGGDPTITNLPAGAGVFTAKETREILTRSGIESHVGEGAYVGGIKITTGGGGKAGSGKLTENLLQQIADYINDILKKAKEALQEQLDAIDEQIEKLKREHDAEEDANKLEELRLKILEAEKKLAEAENERTVRYFNKETGQWEWMADQKAVADAQKALKEAQEAYDKEVAEQAYESQLQALQDQKDSLNEAYNTLADSWETIYEELENILNGKGTVDIAKLIQQLLGTKGGSYAQDIQSLLEAIGAFTANPTSVLDTATTARIMSMNGATGGATSVLSAMLGSGSYDLNGKGQSTLGGNTSIVGDTIYYINGVQIGSDMMNKPLSQILSVLPIYAN